MQIQEPGAYRTPYAWIGGEERVKALVERFYDLMDLEPEFARLRQLHGSSLDQARERLFWFLCGWLGGSQYDTERFDPPRLRARHLHVPIGIAERDQWRACMNRAMIETEVPEDLCEHLAESFFKQPIGCAIRAALLNLNRLKAVSIGHGGS